MKKVFLLVLAGAGAWQLYQDRGIDRPDSFIPRLEASSSSTTPTVPRPAFTCDGREHCSQMNSRAEALYFTNNCPNTKMDGDNDGEPCENDSRF